MRKVIFQCHLIVALVCGVFVVIFGVTGAILAFEPEIDHLTHSHLFYVKPQGQMLSIAGWTAAANKVFPNEKPELYGLPPADDRSAYVAFDSGAVVVNPYTGEILGIRNGPTWLDYVHQFHLRLGIQAESDYGKKIMSWMGFGMLFLAVSGLYLWWPVKRIRISGGADKRRFWFDLHNAVGIVSLVFLLLLSVTGIVIGFERTSTPLFYRITGSQPVRAPKAPPAAEGTPIITPDQAATIARGAVPEAVPILMRMNQGMYTIAARFPEDRTPGGRTRIYVDAHTGQVLLADTSRTTAAGNRLVILNRAIHTGDIFGIPSKMVMSLASLAAVAQFVTGLMMWVKRIRA